jgi:hypothetical protein
MSATKNKVNIVTGCYLRVPWSTGCVAASFLLPSNCLGRFALLFGYRIYWVGMPPVTGEFAGFSTVTVADAIAWLPEASVAE